MLHAAGMRGWLNPAWFEPAQTPYSPSGCPTWRFTPHAPGHCNCLICLGKMVHDAPNEFSDHNLPFSSGVVQLVGPDQLRMNEAKPVFEPGPHQIQAGWKWWAFAFPTLSC